MVFHIKTPPPLSLSQCFLEMFRKMKLILVGYFVKQISRISFLIIFFLYYLLHNIVETTVLKVCNPLVQHHSRSQVKIQTLQKTFSIKKIISKTRQNCCRGLQALVSRIQGGGGEIKTFFIPFYKIMEIVIVLILGSCSYFQGPVHTFRVLFIPEIIFSRNQKTELKKNVLVGCIFFLS